MAEPVLRDSILEWARPNECQTVCPHLPPTFFHVTSSLSLLLSDWLSTLSCSRATDISICVIRGDWRPTRLRRAWDVGKGGKMEGERIKREGTIRRDKPSCPTASETRLSYNIQDVRCRSQMIYAREIIMQCRYPRHECKMKSGSSWKTWKIPILEIKYENITERWW